MRVLVQWTQRDPTDWVELDSAAWAGLARRPVPAHGELGGADNAPGWIFDVVVQGIHFGACDHMAIEDVKVGTERGIRVTRWNDDPDDYPAGTRFAQVWTILDPAHDPLLHGRLVDKIKELREGGQPGPHLVREGHPVLDETGVTADDAINTRQSVVVYAEDVAGMAARYADVRPWSEFAPPADAITRHGVWVADELSRAHVAAQTPRGWREWIPPKKARGRPRFRPHHTKTYYLGLTAMNVGYTPVGVVDLSLDDATGTAGTQTLTAAASDVDGLDAAWTTGPGDPPFTSTWPSGNWHMQIDVSACGADITWSTSNTTSHCFNKILNDGSAASSSSSSGDSWDSNTGTGLKLLTLTSVQLGSQSGTQYRFSTNLSSSNAAMMSETYTIQNLRTATTYADAPYAAYAHVTKDVGSRFKVVGPPALYFRDLYPGAEPGPNSGMHSTALSTLNGGSPNADSMNQSMVREAPFNASGSVSVGSQPTTGSLEYRIPLGRFISEPLAAQTIGAGTWRATFFVRVTQSDQTAFYNLSLYIWRPSTQAVVGYIYDSTTDLGNVWVTTALHAFADVSGSNVTCQDGDVLVLEVWAHGTAGATPGSSTAAFDTTPSSVDLLQPPTTISFRADASGGVRFRGSSRGSDAASLSVSVSPPPGVLNGDGMVAFVRTRGDATINTPTGWTSVRSDANGAASTDWKVAVFKRVASSEASTTFSATGATNGIDVIWLAYAGAHADVVDTSGANTGNSASEQSPSLTPASASSMYVAATVKQGTAYSDFPDIYQATTTVWGQSATALAAWHNFLPSTSAQGALTWSITSGLWVASAVIIKPAAGATGATRDVGSRFRAIAQAIRDVGTRFRLSGTPATRDVASRARVTASSARDVVSRFPISARVIRDVGSRFTLSLGATGATRDVATRFFATARSIRDVPTRTTVVARTFRNVPSRFVLAGGTRMWLRDITRADAPTAGTKSAVLPVGSATSNSGATNLSLALSGHRGSSQVSRSVASDQNANHQDQLIARFTSDPLATGVVSAQQWTIALAAAEADAHANSYLVASLYVWRPGTSAVVGYVYDSDAPLDGEWDPAERGLVASFSGASVTGQPKDVLVLEVWRHTTGAV